MVDVTARARRIRLFVQAGCVMLGCILPVVAVISGIYALIDRLRRWL